MVEDASGEFSSPNDAAELTQHRNKSGNRSKEKDAAPKESFEGEESDRPSKRKKSSESSNKADNYDSNAGLSNAHDMNSNMNPNMAPGLRSSVGSDYGYGMFHGMGFNPAFHPGMGPGMMGLGMGMGMAMGMGMGVGMGMGMPMGPGLMHNMGPGFGPGMMPWRLPGMPPVPGLTPNASVKSGPGLDSSGGKSTADSGRSLGEGEGHDMGEDGSGRTGDAPNSGGNGPRGKGIFYRTKFCMKWRNGTCPYITNCNFAHSLEELRKPPPGWEDFPKFGNMKSEGNEDANKEAGSSSAVPLPSNLTKEGNDMADKGSKEDKSSSNPADSKSKEAIEKVSSVPQPNGNDGKPTAKINSDDKRDDDQNQVFDIAEKFEKEEKKDKYEKSDNLEKEKVEVNEIKPKSDVSLDNANLTKDQNQSDLKNKGKYCKRYTVENGCPYGDRCIFLHDESASIRFNSGMQAPRGTSTEGQSGSAPSNSTIVTAPSAPSNPSSAQSPANNVKPPNWRTRICKKWEMTGSCQFGDKCHFAHGAHELQRFGGGALDTNTAQTNNIDFNSKSPDPNNPSSISSAPTNPNFPSPGSKDRQASTDSNVPTRLSNLGLESLSQALEANREGLDSLVASLSKRSYDQGPSQDLYDLPSNWKGPRNGISTVYGDWIEDQEWDEEEEIDEEDIELGEEEEEIEKNEEKPIKKNLSAPTKAANSFGEKGKKILVPFFKSVPRKVVESK